MKSSFSVSIIYNSVRRADRPQNRIRRACGVGIISYLVELDDVRVTNFFQNLDLSRDAFHILLVVDLFLLKNFDCHLRHNNNR